MNKHTPGPWEIDNGIISQSNGAAYVAEIRRNKFCENSEANNRLIAAAPELLEALQKYEAARVRKVLHEDGSVTLEMDFKTETLADAATKYVRDAIAKATGE